MAEVFDRNAAFKALGISKTEGFEVWSSEATKLDNILNQLQTMSPGAVKENKTRDDLINFLINAGNRLNDLIPEQYRGQNTMNYLKVLRCITDPRPLSLDGVSYTTIPNIFRSISRNHPGQYGSVLEVMSQPFLLQDPRYKESPNLYNNYQHYRIVNADLSKDTPYLLFMKNRVAETKGYIEKVCMYEALNDSLAIALDNRRNLNYITYATGNQNPNPNGVTNVNYKGINVPVPNYCLNLRHEPLSRKGAATLKNVWVRGSAEDVTNVAMCSVSNATVGEKHIILPNGEKAPGRYTLDNDDGKPGLFAFKSLLKPNTRYSFVVADCVLGGLNPFTEKYSLFSQIKEFRVVTFITGDMVDGEITVRMEELEDFKKTYLGQMQRYTLDPLKNDIEGHTTTLRTLRMKLDILRRNHRSVVNPDPEAIREFRKYETPLLIEIASYEDTLEKLTEKYNLAMSDFRAVELAYGPEAKEVTRGKLAMPRFDLGALCCAFLSNLLKRMVALEGKPDKVDWYLGQYTTSTIIVIPHTLSFSPVDAQTISGLYGWFPRVPPPKIILADGEVIELKDLNFNIGPGELCSVTCFLDNIKFKELIHYARTSGYLTNAHMSFDEFYKKFENIDHLAPPLNYVDYTNTDFPVMEIVKIITEAGVRDHEIKGTEVYRPDDQQLYKIAELLFEKYPFNFDVNFESMEGIVTKSFLFGRNPTIGTGYFAPLKHKFSISVRLIEGHAFNYSTLNPKGTPQEKYLNWVQMNLDKLPLVSRTNCPEYFEKFGINPKRIGDEPLSFRNFSGFHVRVLSDMVGKSLLYSKRCERGVPKREVKLSKTVPSGDSNSVLVWPVIEPNGHLKSLKVVNLFNPSAIEDHIGFEHLISALSRRPGGYNIYLCMFKGTYRMYDDHIACYDNRYTVTVSLSSDNSTSKVKLRRGGVKVLEFKDPEKILKGDKNLEALKRYYCKPLPKLPKLSRSEADYVEVVYGALERTGKWIFSREDMMDYYESGFTEASFQLVSRYLAAKKEVGIESSLISLAKNLSERLGAHSYNLSKEFGRKIDCSKLPSTSAISRQYVELSGAASKLAVCEGEETTLQKYFLEGGALLGPPGRIYKAEGVAEDMKKLISFVDDGLSEFYGPSLSKVPHCTNEDLLKLLLGRGVLVRLDITGSYPHTIRRKTAPAGPKVKLTFDYLLGTNRRILFPGNVITSAGYRNIREWSLLTDDRYHFEAIVNVKLINLNGKLSKIYYDEGKEGSYFSVLEKPGETLYDIPYKGQAIRRILQDHEVEITVISGMCHTEFTYDLAHVVQKLCDNRDFCTLWSKHPNLTEEEKEKVKLAPVYKEIMTGVYGNTLCNNITRTDKYLRFSNCNGATRKLECIVKLDISGRRFAEKDNPLYLAMSEIFVKGGVEKLTTFIPNLDDHEHVYTRKFTKGKGTLNDILRTGKEGEGSLGLQPKPDYIRMVSDVLEKYEIGENPEDLEDSIKEELEELSDSFEGFDDDLDYLDELDSDNIHSHDDRPAVKIVKYLYEKILASIPYTKMVSHFKELNSLGGKPLPNFKNTLSYETSILEWVINSTKVITAYLLAKRREYPADLSEDELRKISYTACSLIKPIKADGTEYKNRKTILDFLYRWMSITAPDPIQYYWSDPSLAILIRPDLLISKERYDDDVVRIIKEKSDLSKVTNFCDVGTSTLADNKNDLFDLLDMFYTTWDQCLQGDTDSFTATLDKYMEMIDNDPHYFYKPDPASYPYTPPKGKFGKLVGQISPECKMEGYTPLTFRTPGGKLFDCYPIIGLVYPRPKVYMDDMIARNEKGDLCLISNRKASGCDASMMTKKDYMALCSGFTYVEGNGGRYTLESEAGHATVKGGGSRCIKPLPGSKPREDFEDVWKGLGRIQKPKSAPIFTMPVGTLPC
jgi:hypothetical protein